MGTENSNFPINTYKHISRDKKDNQTENRTAEKKDASFFRILPGTK